jgi:AraC family transcriptional regulator
MLCAFVSKNSKTDGYKDAHIAAQTYLVLHSDTFKRDYKENDFFKLYDIMYKAFYSEWLPTANYEAADGASFEIYGGSGNELTLELWYPIIPK